MLLTTVSSVPVSRRRIVVAGSDRLLVARVKHRQPVSGRLGPALLEALGRLVPLPIAIVGQQPRVGRRRRPGRLADAASRLVAEQGMDRRRPVAADDPDPVDLEGREAGQAARPAPRRSGSHAIGLGQPLDPRGEVHRVADQRIGEALGRAHIADAARARR